MARNRLTVDLSAQVVRAPDGSEHHFEIEAEAKEMLLEALSDTDSVRPAVSTPRHATSCVPRSCVTPSRIELPTHCRRASGARTARANGMWSNSLRLFSLTTPHVDFDCLGESP